jgi:hypothetical protein
MNEFGIVQVCDYLGLSYSPAYSGTNTWGPHISISCPLAPIKHGDAYDSNLSCSIQINPDGPSGAKCWSANCNYKGSFYRLIRLGIEIREKGTKNPELRDMLAKLQGIEEVTLKSVHDKVANELKKMAEVQKKEQEDREIIPESDFEPFLGKVPRYALDRGISLVSAKRWGLGYDEPKGYLVFPMRRRDGKLVGMIGRAAAKRAKRRHHNYAGLDKSKYLFGAQLLEIGKPVVIVEGCVDAIKTDQALLGEACVVAALGEGFSQTHAKTIASVSPPCVYIFTDGDSGGHMLGSKMEYALRQAKIPMRLMECPWGPITGHLEDGTEVRPKVDPAMLPPEYIQFLFRRARLIKDQIRWTDPPPVWEPKAA